MWLLLLCKQRDQPVCTQIPSPYPSLPIECPRDAHATLFSSSWILSSCLVMESVSHSWHKPIPPTDPEQRFLPLLSPVLLPPAISIPLVMLLTSCRLQGVFCSTLSEALTLCFLFPSSNPQSSPPWDMNIASEFSAPLIAPKDSLH